MITTTAAVKNLESKIGATMDQLLDQINALPKGSAEHAVTDRLFRQLAEYQDQERRADNALAELARFTTEQQEYAAQGYRRDASWIAQEGGRYAEAVAALSRLADDVKALGQLRKAVRGETGQ